MVANLWVFYSVMFNLNPNNIKKTLKRCGKQNKINKKKRTCRKYKNVMFFGLIKHLNKHIIFNFEGLCCVFFCIHLNTVECQRELLRI